jgi:hypothetical protein
MKKNVKNEELQSRREFFKKAAKGALPILGAVLLAGAPAIVNAAAEPRTGCYGCGDGCHTGCKGCLNSCSRSCTGCSSCTSCKGYCTGTSK